MIAPFSSDGHHHHHHLKGHPSNGKVGSYNMSISSSCSSSSSTFMMPSCVVHLGRCRLVATSPWPPAFCTIKRELDLPAQIPCWSSFLLEFWASEARPFPYFDFVIDLETQRELWKLESKEGARRIGQHRQNWVFPSRPTGLSCIRPQPFIIQFLALHLIDGSGNAARCKQLCFLIDEFFCLCMCCFGVGKARMTRGNPQAYGEASYWDNRYRQDTGSFDWYQQYAGLAPVLQKYVPKASRILMVGCGNAG